MSRKVLVVLSGGQDSTTTLAWAKQNFDEVHALTFNYGQRHAREIESAKKVAEMLGVASHEVVNLGPVLIGSSPLVNKSNDVGQYSRTEDMPGGIEPTFVPGRNALFAVIAANRAVAVGAKGIIMGVSQEDYGGYPDCRKDFIDSMAESLSLAMTGQKFQLLIHTPLLNLTKKETVEMASTLPGCMDALAFSHTCYAGEYPPDPRNHASMLRGKGFRQAGLPDPLILRAKKEGLLPTDYPDDGFVPGTKYASVRSPDEMRIEELRAKSLNLGLKYEPNEDQAALLKKVKERLAPPEEEKKVEPAIVPDKPEVVEAKKPAVKTAPVKIEK